MIGSVQHSHCTNIPQADRTDTEICKQYISDKMCWQFTTEKLYNSVLHLKLESTKLVVTS